MMAFKLLTTLVFLISISGMYCKSLEERIRDDSDLSQFYDLLERSEIAMASLKFRSVTLFAPTNQAFQRFTGNKTNVLYHISTTAYTLEQLPNTLSTDFDGNPPLFITRKRGHNSEDIFVNNAQIVKSRSNVVLTNENKRKQVLHVIEDVLTPLTTSPAASTEIYNPDAFQFITHYESLDIGAHRIRSFRQRVVMNKKEHVYQADGFHTFFIPVEEGFKPPPRPEMIDKKVIDGHVIPGKVVFTSAAPLEEPLETLAFEDNLKVTVTFFTQPDGKHTKMYVKSNTVVGDSKHTNGVVMAEIVKANIPVKNGVVHLIHRPLMIVDTTVQQFLEEKEDGPLFKFYEVIMDVGGEFMKTINQMRDVTLFAPNNDAWNQPGVRNVLGNRTKMMEILNLHLVHDRLNSEKIRTNNVNHITQIPTYADKKFLYFNVLNAESGTNKTITVEGGGVNATILQSDIAATNGFVHIIDRVLGVPYTTVKEKLETDPMLNDTLWLGTHNKFNEQLDQTTVRFTYFVPRDKAWKSLETDFPSTYKKLFMNEFSYHANNILQRHLVVADRVFTMNDLKHMSNDTIILPTIRDSLKIRVREEDKRYSIMWNNRKIFVFRPDVYCTNGIIHVIDRPFVEESDIKISYSTASTLNRINEILLPTIIMAVLTKLFI